MYTCIIIDDEPHSIESLKKYIDSFPGLILIQSYTDPLLALKEILQAEPVDLILLDIDMPKINGIELSKEIRQQAKRLVFTTGHTQYGYEAIKVKADDYLLKPYTLAEFMISMSKLFVTEAAQDKAIESSDFFFVKSKDDNLKMVCIKYADVIAVESKLNYILISTKTKKVLTYMSLTEISKILFKLSGFLKFNRSFIIAQDHIDFIEGNSITMTDGTKVTVGDFYRKDFSQFMHKKLLKTERKPDKTSYHNLH